MKKKNILTKEDADRIYERLKEDAIPSTALKEYVHNVLLRNAHYLWQYKIGNKRFGYCTFCKKDFPLEIKDKRTYTTNDVAVLGAKHNDKVICPCCGREVTKRYAGISRPDVYVDAAEFKVDKTGALIVYMYVFHYDYKRDFHIDTPHFHCFNIGYFDLHRYFHLLHGRFGSTITYLGDKYTGTLEFTTNNAVAKPSNNNQREEIHCFGLEEALQSSNLKYSCLMQYIDNDTFPDMLRYLKMYCSYPELTEKLMKEGYSKILISYVHGGVKGCLNFRGKNVNDVLRLDKQHLKFFNENTRDSSYYYETELKAVQFIQENKIKTDQKTYQKTFNFISKYHCYLDLIKLLYQFVGIQKLQTYAKKQGLLCSCRFNYSSYEAQFFQNYRDYIAQCKKLNYDLKDKSIVMPANLYQSHCQLTEILNMQAIEQKKEEKTKALKAFEKRLVKLQKKYTFSDGMFLIRPATGYEDLCAEAAALHHCVYSNYADKYIKGKTDIFLIRKASEPDKPYYTVEFKNNSVIQCRTKYNGGATDEINAFLKKWQNNLKTKSKNQKEAA